ncbi:hypothetical protein [Leptospira noguchii]|uniref:hypothetical protein n=1 Tax=Leptospira noguchii TaxID=28182 RepID=UPI001FB632C1|nr:hypothetical protein [Leptospira noguchii]UOG36309.1 hypothetical protein MAL02_19365 [Leptospira noguchii]
MRKVTGVQRLEDFKSSRRICFFNQQIGKANGATTGDKRSEIQAVVSHFEEGVGKEEWDDAPECILLNAAGGAIRGVLTGGEISCRQIVGSCAERILAHVRRKPVLTSHSYEHTLTIKVYTKDDYI